MNLTDDPFYAQVAEHIAQTLYAKSVADLDDAEAAAIAARIEQSEAPLRKALEAQGLTDAVRAGKIAPDALELPALMKAVPGVAKWNLYAGGTGAARGKHSYDHYTDHGTYSISPVSSQHGRHLGYQAHFQNTKGKLGGGLWHDLGMHSSPAGAAKAAREHHEKHFGSARATMRKAHGGEGSRGGHVIGHTKSGKPIYDSGHAHYDPVHHAARGRNIHGEYFENFSSAHARKMFPDYSSADHEEAGVAHTYEGVKAKKSGKDAAWHHRLAALAHFGAYVSLSTEEKASKEEALKKKHGEAYRDPKQRSEDRVEAQALAERARVRKALAGAVIAGAIRKAAIRPTLPHHSQWEGATSSRARIYHNAPHGEYEIAAPGTHASGRAGHQVYYRAKGKQGVVLGHAPSVDAAHRMAEQHHATTVLKTSAIRKAAPMAEIRPGAKSIPHPDNWRKAGNVLGGQTLHHDAGHGSYSIRPTTLDPRGKKPRPGFEARYTRRGQSQSVSVGRGSGLGSVHAKVSAHHTGLHLGKSAVEVAAPEPFRR